jgi:hypothetical protein
MSKKFQPSEFIHILKNLEDHRDALASENQLDPQLVLLREWQNKRLENTYFDLLADKRYRPACEFFLNDVYAPRDFSRRDHDAEQLYASLSKYLPEALLKLLADVIYLNQVSNSLDVSLLNVLKNDLGVTDRITPETYSEAYRICDNYSKRKEQIDILVLILRKAGNAARRPIAGISLRLAAVPARQTGWTDLYQFLLRGYQASRPMHNDLDFFINTIQFREMIILDKIFKGDSNPFQTFSEIQT